MKNIETERLLLRHWELGDLDDFYEYAKNPNIGPRAGWKPHSNKEESLSVLKTYITSDEIWAIVLKSRNKVIGQLKIYPDKNRGKYSERNSAKFINYALSDDYWGNGYMTEAVKRAVKYAFEEMNIELLTAFRFPDNIGSRRVLEKCGFRYEITLENGIQDFNGEFHQGVYHSIMKSDYFSK